MKSRFYLWSSVMPSKDKNKIAMMIAGQGILSITLSGDQNKFGQIQLEQAKLWTKY